MCNLSVKRTLYKRECTMTFGQSLLMYTVVRPLHGHSYVEKTYLTVNRNIPFTLSSNSKHWRCYRDLWQSIIFNQTFSNNSFYEGCWKMFKMILIQCNICRTIFPSILIYWLAKIILFMFAISLFIIFIQLCLTTITYIHKFFLLLGRETTTA